MFQIKLNIKPNIKPYIKNVIHTALFILIPAITFYTMESYEHNAFWDVYLTAQMLNILMFELIALFFFFLFGSARVALSVEIGIAMVYGLVNHYVMAFRSTPFVPWDIFSVETAVSVVGNYDLTPTKEVIFATVALVILFVAVQFLDVKFPYKLPIRLIPVLCVSFCLGGFTGMLQNDV